MRILGCETCQRDGWHIQQAAQRDACRVSPFASTELALKHTRNKLYTELVLQELALQE